MSWAAIGISLGTMVASYGLQQASQPTQPDTAKSSKELADTEAALLPARRQMEALAQQGKKGTVTMPASKVQKKMATILGGPNSGQKVPYVASEWVAGGKYNPNGDRKPLVTTETVEGPTTIDVDFTGIGSADVQGAVAQQMAKLQLDLSQKYDAQFIDQALEQERLADPESFAARDKMDQLIHDQINRKPERPVADLLQKQVGDELTAAREGRLDDATQGILDDATRKALADRGGDAGMAGDFADPLTSGFAGEARRNAAVAKAQKWLASGATPEDVAFRREQQNLSNLSAEVTGQTPTSQFKDLSAASTGPTPVSPGAPLSQLPTNTTQTGASAALTQQAAQNSQANPWMAGLSSIINIGSVAGKSGFKPFA